MTFSWSFSGQFATEFSRFPSDQQQKVIDFTTIYQSAGLSDFTKYPGKIAPSWSSLAPTDPVYVYAQSNHLWHYHVGIPHYNQVHPKYQTSDWLLHFQWPGQGTHINVVDVYAHYTAKGAFYVPPPGSLTP